MQINTREVVHGVDTFLNSKSIQYDTIGVYLLAGKNRLFYEFDTFALKTRLVKVGRWEDKPLGQRLNFSDTRPGKNYLYGPLEKAEVNNIPCFVSEIISKESTIEDTTSTRFILMRNPDFNSYFRIYGAKFIDESYCIVGFQVYFKKLKQGLSMELEDLRLLTEKEKAIYQNIVAVSRASVVDTVKNYYKK